MSDAPDVTAAPTRDASGRFRKGSSGNPGGRPPRPPQLQEMTERAQALTPKALAVAEACLDDPDPLIRLAAAKFIWEKGFGKPEQKFYMAPAPAVSINIAAPIKNVEAAAEAWRMLAGTKGLKQKLQWDRPEHESET